MSQIRDKYYLYPGSIFISKKPHAVDTILGSCVSVALWDCVLQFGSINHYMLPHWNREGAPSNKYGDVAIPELIRKMIAFGSNKNNLRAKVFGGSETGTPYGVFHVGARNVKLSLDLLKKEQIPVVSHSVGGIRGRKIVFYSESGEVMIKFIKHASSLEQKIKNLKV